MFAPFMNTVFHTMQICGIRVYGGGCCVMHHNNSMATLFRIINKRVVYTPVISIIYIHSNRIS